MYKTQIMWKLAAVKIILNVCPMGNRTKACPWHMYVFLLYSFFLSEVNILMLSYHTVILIIIHLEFLIRTFFCYVIYLLIFVNNSLSKVYGIQVIIIICMVHMRLKISIVLDHIQ